MIADIQQLLQWLAMHPHWAYATVTASAFLESLAFVGIFFPGAMIMFGAGALVANGTMAFWPTFAAAVLGAVVGDGISYEWGRRGGARVDQVWPFSRYPQLLERGKRFFLRHGGKSIVIGRFVGPVRPVIPVVAGMLKMPPRRFYVTNILSAVAWAPVYLLPGMAFGMALTLAGEVAARLAVLILTVAAILVATVWLVRWGDRHVSAHAANWSASLTTWGQQRHGSIRLIADLFDSERGPQRVLLAWLAILVAGTWLFLGVLEDVVSRDQLVFAGQSVYHFLQQLRTPLGDRAMIAVTELGDAAVTGPLIATVGLWLLIRRRWRDLAYWLAAIGGGVLFVAVLKGSLHIPRPIELDSGVSAYSFPSGHATMSAVVYGALAALVSPLLSSRMRLVLYGAVCVLVGGIAFSRLYLGAHWLADVAGGLSIGSAWVALLTIANRRRQPGVVISRRIGSLIAVVFLLAAGRHTYSQFGGDIERYAVRHPTRDARQREWWASAWRELPAHRLDLEGEREQPLNIQYAGDLARLKESLAATGWHEPVRVSLRNALRWLAPSPSIEDIPVLPKLHNGRSDALRLVHGCGEPAAAGSEQLILRLWRTEVDLQPGDVPLWIGYAVRQKVRRLSFFSFARSAAVGDEPLLALRSGLSAETASRETQRDQSEIGHGSRWNGNTLLVQSSD